MNIKQEKQDDKIIFTLDGEINISTSPQLRKAFNATIEDGLKKVLVDFSGVSYIDSSGLATFIEILQRLKKAGGRLHLSNMNEKVKNVFEITKLIKLFNIYDNNQEAITNF